MSRSWLPTGGRTSALDRMLQRFQHRWELDRQFRATLSGLMALVALVSLCAMLLAATTVTSSALAAIGFGTSRSPAAVGTIDTGTGLVRADKPFPTPTISPWTYGGLPPAQPMPTSQTPQPGVTPTATPPPQPTPTSGGGGGGGRLVCSGGSNPAFGWSLSPCPQPRGGRGTLTIVARANAGATLNIVLNLGTCNGCTYLFTPDLGYRLDGSGQASISYDIPAGAGDTPISGMINMTNPNGSMSINASPAR